MQERQVAIELSLEGTMSLRTLLAGVAFSAAALLSATSANAAVILFDGFESPTQNGGYTYGGTTAAGAIFDSGTGLQANGSAFGYAPAPEGSQTAHIQGAGTIDYNLSGLTAGQTYNVSFYLSSRPGYDNNAVAVSFAGQNISTILQANNDFELQNVSFLAASGTGTLSFAGTFTNGDRNAGIDSVSVSSVTSGVPEPSTWAMMLIGFAGLAFATSRKQTSGGAAFTAA